MIMVKSYLRAPLKWTSWLVCAVTLFCCSVAVAQVGDTAAPVIHITSPGTSLFVAALPVVKGTVSDGDGETASGVNEVHFSLSRTADGLFWGGTAWGNALVELPATVAGTAWSNAGPLPAGDALANGAYHLEVDANDNASNSGVATLDFSVDKIAPITLTITAPAPGSTVGTLPAVSGTVADNTGGSGIYAVIFTLRRVSDGLFWSGSSWAAAPGTALNTTLSTTTADPRTWTRSNSLPAGTQLATGAYAIVATAYDRVGNHRATDAGFTIGTASTDTIPPHVIIDAPAAGAIVAALPAISGHAYDNEGGSGLYAVILYLRRNSDNTYWNGSAWGAHEPVALSTTLGTDHSFIRNSGLPAGDLLTDGVYAVTAYAYDRAGNKTGVSNSFTKATPHTDTVAPNLTIDVPHNGAVIPTLPAISGHAADNEGGSGLYAVILYLRRNSDNTYWNGNAWGAHEPVALITTLGTDHTYGRTSGLPAGDLLADGSYAVTAYAYDKAGNKRGVSISFVKKTPNTSTDTVAPNLSIDTPHGGSTVATLPVIGGHAGDNEGGSGLYAVILYLRRLSDNTYWNGNAWGSHEPVVLSTVLGTDHTYSRSSGLPAGDLLADGAYAITAYAYDHAGNHAGVSASFVKATPRSDTVAPTLTIDVPHNGAVIAALPYVSGHAADNDGGSGLYAVILYLRRNSDNTYWDGSAWSAHEPVALTTTLGTDHNFVRTSGLPAGDLLTDGGYALTAYAYDRAGNKRGVSLSFIKKTPSTNADTVAPHLSIVSPHGGAVVMNLPGISGTAADNDGGSGLDAVVLYLRRNSDNTYWDGGGWSSHEPVALATVAGTNNSWSRTSQLPANDTLPDGIYSITAYASDRAGNKAAVTAVITVRRALTP